MDMLISSLHSLFTLDFSAIRQPDSGFQLSVLLVYILTLALPALLFVPVLRKAGFSAWWALPGCVPYLNIGLLLLFAFVRWPDFPRKSG